MRRKGGEEEKGIKEMRGKEEGKEDSIGKGKRGGTGG